MNGVLGAESPQATRIFKLVGDPLDEPDLLVHPRPYFLRSRAVVRRVKMVSVYMVQRRFANTVRVWYVQGFLDQCHPRLEASFSLPLGVGHLGHSNDP